MQYRNSTYAENTWDNFWFEKNIQGDVVAVYSDAGTKLVSYTYDAWGNHTTTYLNGGATTAAQYNPFRYRGYYYDADLGLYYLNSRYYDSVVGRFISPDNSGVITATPMGLTDKNLYAYCDNNPVMRVDGDGDFWNILAGAIIGFSSQLVTDLVTSAIEGQLSFSHWSSYVGATVGGAVGAAIPGGGILADAVGAAVSTITSTVSYNIESICVGREDEFTFEEICYTTINDTMIAAAGGFLFDNSKLGTKISSMEMSKYGVSDFLRGSGVGVLAGVKNSRSFSWPNTHFWNTPNVERWYPFQ